MLDIISKHSKLMLVDNEFDDNGRIKYTKETNMNELTVINSGSVEIASASNRLLAAFLSGRSPATLRAYRSDIEAFASFLGCSFEAAMSEFLRGGAGRANELAIQFKNFLMEKKLAAASINRSLAALRSIVKLGKTLGMIGWELEVVGLKSEAYRDTAGPGMSGFRSVMSKASSRKDGKGLRDYAILRMAFDLGLRRKEIVGLDLADIDATAGIVAILGKGRTEKSKLTLPEPTKAALQAWVEVRGNESGPLFTNYDRASKGDGRLTGSAVYFIIVALGNQAGLTLRPHGIRHCAITEILELTGGDVRSAAKFSRHRDIRVLTRYDDSRVDTAGDLAKRLAASV